MFRSFPGNPFKISVLFTPQRPWDTLCCFYCFVLFLKVVQRPQPSPEEAQTPRPKHQAQAVLVFPAGDCASSQGSSFSSPAPPPGLWEGCYLNLGTKTSSFPPAHHGDSPQCPLHCTSTGSLQEQLQPLPAPGISLCQASLPSWENVRMISPRFLLQGLIKVQVQEKGEEGEGAGDNIPFHIHCKSKRWKFR